MRKFDDLIKSPLLAVTEPPDTASMIAAVRVQMLLAAGNCASPEDYIIEHYNETPEGAAQIVANCRVESDLD